MDEPTKARASALFASLSHPVRISIVELLAEEAKSVGDIAHTMQLPQSNVSQHLAALLRSGVLNVTPKGTSRLYQVRGPRILRILDLIKEFCEIQGLKGEPTDDLEI